jgi:hypothetical protein
MCLYLPTDCVEWCTVNPAFESYFATAGSRRVTIYESLPVRCEETDELISTIEDKPAVEVVQAFVDEDIAEVSVTAVHIRLDYHTVADCNLSLVLLVLLFALREQSYYAMCWSTDASGAPVIAVGGLRALIKIISCADRKVTAVLAGHGSAVNDIKPHPVSNNVTICFIGSSIHKSCIASTQLTRAEGVVYCLLLHGQLI